ncbi:aspartate kinase [Sporobacter termitidis DSM 10068]|uniref:Aspartokinase n=1 Tax=Sporobacter termitidis DSM 10068 TaxID=1123282 RepID=A0A1M5Y2E5_9FIRM|nr:aspartate kinase [Sporobacter termitidis]SHI06270.1 aspartate kinase [Sporobacter termitidis DSM 10068]
MAFIVQKFGGSSVADAERIRRVAGIIADTYSDNNDVVVVLSAQGDMTDDLIEKANEINTHPSKREMDVLLSTGEQISIALMAMALEKMGMPVVSLTGWQIGMQTNSDYGNARIKKVTCERIRNELDKRRIVIVAGFQGVNRYDDITTLGRGGSDTTAVAIAAAMNADLCQIYTDVEGVYTCDPRKVPNARKLEEITFDEMLELASLGAQVLHNRSVEMAKRYNVNLEVLSSFVRKPGTKVKEVTKVEQTKISGIAKDVNVARIALIGLKDEPGIAFKVFRVMAKQKTNVDIILQSIGRGDTQDISFTVAKQDMEQATKSLREQQEIIGFKDLSVTDKIAKVSMVGAGMVNSSGIAVQMFEALFDAKINIHMISTSEIKVSVLVDEDEADRAIQAIHAKFFEA